MNPRLRERWSRQVDQVIRSRHYTWLGEGLGGESLPEALSCMLTDIMHICKRQDISFAELLESCQERFKQEEARELELEEAR